MRRKFTGAFKFNEVVDVLIPEHSGSTESSNSSVFLHQGKRIKCNIYCEHLSSHLQQILTGFLLLKKKGLVDLSINKPNIKLSKRLFKKVFNRSGNSSQHLDVIVNDCIHIHYDVQDGYGLDHDALERCDKYFKRSYLQDYIDKFEGDDQKIHPLGLNYNVYPDTVDLSFANGAVKSLDKYNLFRYTPRLRQFEAQPDPIAKPKILFMTRAWDPYDRNDRPEHEKEERIQINETRAQVIKLLREQFGSSFCGGFKVDDYSIKHYPSLLSKDTKKNSYIERMKTYPICVATTGLHGSIGWKFAEYVASARAILSEKLNYEVPGNFCKNNNYLEFSSPEECVEMANQLFNEPELRAKLMVNNAQYYRQSLRPDSLVMNTLIKALSGEKVLQL